MSGPKLWTQEEAAQAMSLSQRYLRDSDCPKVFLPSTKPGGRPLLRYDAEQCRAWWLAHSTKQEVAA